MCCLRVKACRSADRQSPPTVWARSGGPARSCNNYFVSVLYAVFEGNKTGLGTRAASLSLSVCELAYLLVASIICIICSAVVWADSYPVRTRKNDYTKSLWVCQGDLARFKRQFRHCLGPCRGHFYRAALMVKPGNYTEAPSRCQARCTRH
jgi:hypothetical protein